MANEIRLVTYANQQVTPQNDAVLTNLETPNNGIIFGCEISIKNASTLHINSGMGVIYGREFEIVDSDISVPLPGAGTELGQLYIHIDLANTSAPVQLLIETGASLTPLVDDANLNVTTGITEYQLATFNVSTATISDLVVTFESTKDIRSELGTADISGIGDGSVKGAISRINSDLSDYTKDFEILSELVAFTNFDIALPQNITTGSKLHILIHESSVDIWFTKELIAGIDIFLNQPANRIFNVGGYYIDSNTCGSCFVQATANGRLQYNSIQLNGADKSRTTTISCVLFRA